MAKSTKTPAIKYVEIDSRKGEGLTMARTLRAVSAAYLKYGTASAEVSFAVCDAALAGNPAVSIIDAAKDGWLAAGHAPGTMVKIASLIRRVVRTIDEEGDAGRAKVQELRDSGLTLHGDVMDHFAFHKIEGMGRKTGSTNDNKAAPADAANDGEFSIAAFYKDANMRNAKVALLKDDNDKPALSATDQSRLCALYAEAAAILGRYISK